MSINRVTGEKGCGSGGGGCGGGAGGATGGGSIGSLDPPPPQAAISAGPAVSRQNINVVTRISLPVQLGGLEKNDNRFHLPSEQVGVVNLFFIQSGIQADCVIQAQVLGKNPQAALDGVSDQ